MTDFSEFEELLRGQPLRGPSVNLDARIESVFEQTSAVRRRGRRHVWAALAGLTATAAAVFVVLHVANRPAEQPQMATIEPDVKIEQVWSAVVERKVIAEAGRPAAEEHQVQVVRHVRWVDDRNQVEIEWNISSEQSAVVPAEYN